MLGLAGVIGRDRQRPLMLLRGIKKKTIYDTVDATTVSRCPRPVSSTKPEHHSGKAAEAREPGTLVGGATAPVGIAVRTCRCR